MNLFVAVALSLFVASPDAKPDPAKQAQDSLQGEWKFVEFVKLGRPNPDLVKNGKVVIAKDNFTIRIDDEDNTLTFTLDPKVDPPALDFRSNRDGNKKPVRGIYKLEMDNLTICFGVENSLRPTEFKAGGNNSIMVLERVKK